MIRNPLLLVPGLAVAAGLFAQAPKVEFPAPSPAATIRQRVGLTDVEVVYSRPGKKGRDVFTLLAPYGKVWRTGANTETRITFSTAVKLNGADIPAGTYGLFTIPGATEWTVIIDRNSKMWGAYTYDPKDDLVRIKATPVALSEPVETFTIEFSDLHDTSATVNLMWDKVRVPLTLEVDFVPQVVAQIDAVMAAPPPPKPYMSAAQFYLEYGLDLKKALAWVDTALAANPAAFYLDLLRARILAKMGDRNGAVTAARQAIDLARKVADTEPAESAEYIRLSQDLIASLDK